MAERPFLGILGGTFDPIHHGHLRLAVEVAERLGLDRVHLTPSADPPHRSRVFAPAALRLEMVEAAVSACPLLVADGCELARSGPSFTVDTLAEFRRRYPDAALAFVMGADAFAELPRWHRFEMLTELAHLVVVNRPGVAVTPHPEIDAFAHSKWQPEVAILRNEPSGGIHAIQMPVLDIASSDIRARRAAGRHVDFLTPTSVVDLIRAHGLYLEPNPVATA